AAVAAYDDQPLDAAPAQHLGGARATFGLHERLAARGAQDGAAALDDVRHAARAELREVALDQPLVAAEDACHRDAVMRRGSDDGADGRVHAGSVAAAGEHADVSHRT